MPTKASGHQPMGAKATAVTTPETAAIATAGRTPSRVRESGSSMGCLNEVVTVDHVTVHPGGQALG